jgi:pimeloyl-ACP methyl ester carboxylesterase
MENVQANGLRFAYLAEGEGPLVLLLHGFPDSARTWDRTLPILAGAGFRAVAPWMRGYAPTEIPSNGDFRQETLGRDVVALIEALGYDDAIVVGHDWGASACYCAVGLAPERIRMLVTMAVPHPAGILPTPRMLWAVRHFLSLRRRGAATKIRAGELRYIDELWSRWSPGWNVPAGETDAVKESLAEPGALEAAVGYYRALSPRLPASQRQPVTVPAVAFAGEHDVVPSSAYDRAASRYAAGYEVVRMPGGHFLHRQHPDIFHRELLRVLDGGPGPR